MSDGHRRPAGLAVVVVSTAMVIAGSSLSACDRPPGGTKTSPRPAVGSPSTNVAAATVAPSVVPWMRGRPGAEATPDESAVTRFSASPDALASVHEPVSSDTVVVLDRGPCGGRCPDYRVSLFHGGRVVYEGRSAVRTTGTLVDAIEQEKLRALVESLRAADFFGLREHVGAAGEKDCQATSSDDPIAKITVTMDGRTKTVFHHHRCLTPLSEHLAILEDKIDRVANTVRWVR